MKKNIVWLVAIVFFLLSFFVIAKKNSENEKKKETEVMGNNGVNKKEEKRAIYLSYIEFNSYIKDKNMETSQQNIQKMLDQVKEYGFNTVIVHVRPFADSIYPSSYYPISDTVLNDKGEKPDYDVLAYFIEQSHKRNLFFEAWINPFRVSNLTDLSLIPSDSPYYRFVGTKDAKIIEGKGIYLNPASSEVRKYIEEGIREIVENYDVDGIHFDDYFYPDKTIDLSSYKIYQKEGGELSISDYRMEQISILLKDTYSLIKEIRPSVSFGIAPEGNIENDYENSFLDVRKILSEKGYIDYIMPQIYFGFENQNKPFIDTIYVWNSLITEKTIQLIPALAFYKIGTLDTYAGTGEKEWVEQDDVIKKQVLIARNTSQYGGFSLFRYDYLFNSVKYQPNTLGELKHLKEILV